MTPPYGDLLKLSVHERIQLVEDLWDSIAEEDLQLPIADWKAAELQERKNELLGDPGGAASWESIKEEYLGTNTGEC